MAYIGQPPNAFAPLSSADIPDGIIEAADLHTNAVFASGTKMIFNQTAAPTGWTKVTGSGNDHALRVTTGTVGTGGSVAFETAFASQTIPTHSISEAEMPSHDHQTVNASGEWYAQSGTGGTGLLVGSGYTNPSLTGATTGTAGSGTAHGHGSVDLNVNFVDVIIATKD